MKFYVSKSFAETNPELISEWHSEWNGDLTPYNVSYGSDKKVWWVCNSNPAHVWTARITNRHRGAKCPYCTGRKVNNDNCLAAINPELVSEWHPELNGDLTPYNVTCCSHKKAWWICSSNPEHVWSAEIKARHSGSKCPYCSGKKADIDNCLAAANPDLVSEWHPELNGDLTPYNVTGGSQRRVWWICRSNPAHVWNTQIATRHYGSKCPYCSGKRASIDNCLATINPELASEWHPDKNDGLTPNDVTPNSNKKVWWRCSDCGFEWHAQIVTRNHGSRCPSCGSKSVTDDICLSTVNPILASQWHPTLNKRLTPDEVAANSSRKVYWLCEKCGHEWKAAVGERSSNDTGCPDCGERKVLNSENCLAAIHPELIAQWDQKRNGDLTPYDVFHESSRKVYWRCSKGHEYQMRVKDKSNGMTCPVCRRRQNTKFPKQALYYYLNDVFKDTIRKYLYAIENKRIKLDIFIPSLNLGIEYDGYLPHMRPNSDVFDEQKNQVLKDAVHLIRVREEGLPQINNFGSTVIMRNETTENASLAKCLVSIGEYIKSQYDLSKEQLKQIEGWNTLNIDKDEAIIGTYISKNARDGKFKVSMAQIRPDLLEEWDYSKNGELSPFDMPYGTSKKAWWICKTCKNSYEAQIRHRVGTVKDGIATHSTGCPKCGYRKIAEVARKLMIARNAARRDSAAASEALGSE